VKTSISILAITGLILAFAPVTNAALDKKSPPSPGLEPYLQHFKQGKADDSQISNVVTLIEKAPAASQGETAYHLAQALAGNAKGKDAPKLAGQIAGKLPPAVLKNSASGLIYGFAEKHPAQLPQIVAAVLGASPDLMKDAGPILAAIIADGSPHDAPRVAAAVAALFADNPQLAAQAQSIAVELTKTLLTMDKTTVITPCIAETVAAIISQLPGNPNDNLTTINKIGQAIAAITPPEMAAAIIGVVDTAMRTVHGYSYDLKEPIAKFSEPFTSKLGDYPKELAKIAQRQEDVDTGAKVIYLPTDPHNYFGWRGALFHDGSLVKHETPKTGL